MPIWSGFVTHSSIFKIISWKLQDPPPVVWFLHLLLYAFDLLELNSDNLIRCFKRKRLMWHQWTLSGCLTEIGNFQLRTPLLFMLILTAMHVWSLLCIIVAAMYVWSLLRMLVELLGLLERVTRVIRNSTHIDRCYIFLFIMVTFQFITVIWLYCQFFTFYTALSDGRFEPFYPNTGFFYLQVCVPFSKWYQ